MCIFNNIYHSTETALTLIIDDILISLDNKSPCYINDINATRLI